MNSIFLLLICRLLLLPLPLLPRQEIGPVEEVEDGKDAGEENSGKDVNLLGSELKVGEPGRHSVRRNSEQKHLNLLSMPQHIDS